MHLLINIVLFSCICFNFLFGMNQNHDRDELVQRVSDLLVSGSSLERLNSPTAIEQLIHMDANARPQVHEKLLERDELLELLREKSQDREMPIGGVVYSIAYDQKGEMLAAGTEDGGVMLFDSKTREYHYLEKPKGGITNIEKCCFHPSGNEIATKFFGSTVRLYDTRTGEFTRVMDHEESEMRFATKLAYNPNGKERATVYPIGMAATEIHIEDAKTGETLKKYSINENYQAFCLAYHPTNGQLALAGQSTGVILLWNTQTENQPHKILDHNIEPVRDLCYRHDGKQLASFSGNNRASMNRLGSLIRLLGPDTGKCLRIIPLEQESYSFAYAPKGNQLAVGQRNRIQFWNSDTGNCTHVYDLDHHNIISLAYHPEGHTLAIGGNFRIDAVRLLNLCDPEVKRTLSAMPTRNILFLIKLVQYIKEGKPIDFKVTEEFLTQFSGIGSLEQKIKELLQLPLD